MKKLNKVRTKRNYNALYYRSSGMGNGCWFVISIFLLIFIIPVLIGGDTFVNILDHIFKNVWTGILFFILPVLIPLILILAYYLFKSIVTSQISSWLKCCACFAIFAVLTLLTVVICFIYG
ncbi:MULTISPECIES: hypothetical protein [Staphylococcus]|uniref:hypothetical protein n=1 Tax=Staphylococcus TaxID=1279 RepID=UPI000DF7DDE8|nr:hypothetical protein [Staphylococcus sp. EZ-P03]